MNECPQCETVYTKGRFCPECGYHLRPESWWKRLQRWIRRGN